MGEMRFDETWPQTIVRQSLRGQTTFFTLFREQSWSPRLGIGRGVIWKMLSEMGKALSNMCLVAAGKSTD